MSTAVVFLCWYNFIFVAKEKNSLLRLRSVFPSYLITIPITVLNATSRLSCLQICHFGGNWGEINYTKESIHLKQSSVFMLTLSPKLSFDSLRVRA